MEKFEPGDRVVRIRSTDECEVPVGSVGTFLAYDEGWKLCGAYGAMVRWDDKVPNVHGHTCGGRCERGYGWEVPECDLEFCSDEPLDESDYDTSDINSMIDAMFGGELD